MSSTNFPAVRVSDHEPRDIRTETGDSVAWVGCFPTEKAHEIARRLVACWNACQSIKTEDLEREGFIGKMILAACDTIRDDEAEAAKARHQTLVDALAATETYLLERVSAKAGSTGATKILPMIRAALEGAKVAPTPTSWGDC